METIASDLKVSELKQNNLFKSYEGLHSQASAFLAFSLQWKDLESHLDSARNTVQIGLEALLEREKAVASREEAMTARESRLESDLALRTSELERIEGLIGERSIELVMGDRQIDSLKAMIAEIREELDVKEKGYTAVLKSVESVRSHVAEPERNFERVKNEILVVEGKWSSLEKKIKQKLEEAESAEKEVASTRKMLRKLKHETEMKQRKLNSILRSVNKRKKELDLEEEQLQLCRYSIEESDKVIESKKDELCTIQASITNISSELELKEKRLGLLHKKDTESKDRYSVDRFAQVFEARKKNIEGLLEQLELKEKSYESTVQEANLIAIKVDDCLKEVESREELIESLKNSVEKRRSDLQTKERQFRKNVLDFNQKQKTLGSPQKPNEVTENEKTHVDSHSQVKAEPSEHALRTNIARPLSSSRQKPSTTTEGKYMHLLLNRLLKHHDAVCNEVFTVLRVSKDPFKLVMDAIEEGFYPPPRRDGESFDLSIVRRSCILLLEQLMMLPVLISPRVKERAMEFANCWRAKMKGREPEYLEALGFLHFVTDYHLIRAFSPNELYRLVDIVGEHGRSPKLQQALSSADGSPTGKLEFVQDLEISLATIMTNPPNLQLDTMVSILNILTNSPDPANYVLDYIQGPFSQPWKTDHVDVNVLKNWIILLEQLLRMQTRIQPRVRDAAMKVAAEWKPSVEAKAENALGILVFLQFIDTFGLISSFDDDEIIELLKKTCWDDSVLGVLRSVGFSKIVPEMIQNLLQKKKFVDAIKLICAFGLTDKFSPKNILIQYMEDLKDSTAKVCKQGNKFTSIEVKEVVADEEISALRDVRECIDKLKLSSSIPLDQIDTRITILENTKVQRRRDLNLDHASVKQEHEQEQKKPMKKRGPRSGFPNQQGKHKVLRTDSSRQ